MSINYFFRELAKMEFETPISTKINIYVAILVVVLILYFIFGNTNMIDLLKDNYNYYFILVIINLVNIILVLTYYSYYSGTYVGEPGKKGDRGKKGQRGKFISCSFCKSNIFTQKSNRYSKIVNVNETAKLDIENDAVVNKIMSYTKRANELGAELKDLKDKEFINSMKEIIGTNMDKYITIRGMVYKSIQEINNKISNGLTKYPGSFHRASGRLGYFPLGDTPFRTAKASKMNSFMVSGDVRNPVEFKKIVTFDTLEREGETINGFIVSKFTIWRPIGPEDFKTMGDVVQFGTDPPNNNIVACIKGNCLKKLDESKELEMMFIHYGIQGDVNETEEDARLSTFKRSYQIINKKINKIKLYSIWRTPINSFVTYSVNDEDIKTDSLIFNLIGHHAQYLDKYGDINEKGKKFVKTRLKSIKLSRPLRVLLILSFYQTYYSKMMDQFIEENREDLGKLRKSESEKIIRAEYQRLLVDKQKEVPYMVQSNETLYDVAMVLFPQGFEERVTTDTKSNDISANVLMPIQIDLLKVMMVLFPPKFDLYMIKNECLSYNRIDFVRRKLINRTTNEILTNEKYMDVYKVRPELYCDSGKGVKNEIYKLDDLLGKHLGHINNYLKKIETRELDSFTNNRLNLIYKLYKDFNTYLEKSCDSLVNIKAKQAIYKLAERVIQYNTLQNIPKENCQNVEYINGEIKKIQNELMSELISTSIWKEKHSDIVVFNYLHYLLTSNVYSIFNTIEIDKMKKAYKKMNDLLIDSCDQNYDDLEKNPEYIKYQAELKETLREKLVLDISDNLVSV